MSSMYFQTRLEKKIVLSALRMLLNYYEVTGISEGTLTRIANTIPALKGEGSGEGGEEVS